MPTIKGPTTLTGGARPSIRSQGVLPENTLNVCLASSSGSEDMVVDGSSTPVPFSYTVAPNQEILINRILVYLDDSTSFISTKFGAINALTNGVDITANGHLLVNWKTNINIAVIMHDYVGYKNMGKEDKSGSGRWTFTSAFGFPVYLDAGEQFIATVNDAMAGLDNFTVCIQGRKYNK